MKHHLKDILIKNKDNNESIKIREILYFFKKLGIKNLGEGNVKKLYKAGFNTIPKILNASETDFLEVDGFKQKSAKIIYNSIHKKLVDLDLGLLMAASNVFGYGFGYERAKLILEKYPNILTDYKKMSKEILDLIVKIPSFEEKTAKQFVDYLKDFDKYYQEIAKFITLKATKLKKLGNKFENQVVVFTGFRDEEMENSIISQGGTIGKAFNNNTTMVIWNDEEVKNGNNSKILKAKEKGIKILTKNELQKMLK